MSYYVIFFICVSTHCTTIFLINYSVTDAYKFLTNNNIVQFLYLAIFIFAHYKSSLKYEICNISRNNRKNNQLAERLIKRTCFLVIDQQCVEAHISKRTYK